MALKDLIAEKSALDEAAIEKIVASYVRYDLETKAVTFMPAFAMLSNKAKVLVYLVALQGWKFVADETVAADARPADIEAATGIPGGSLRPLLRTLCESHILHEKDSRYSVRSTAFHVIESELGGSDEPAVTSGARSTARKSRRARKRGAQSPGAEEKSDDAVADPDKSRARKASGKTSIASTFESWIDEGYFDEPRTLSDAQQRFRKEAIIVPQTSLPGYFLGAVRRGRLTRDEIEENGRTVWAYTTKQSA